MSKQKYHKGDHVRVAKDLGPSMSHFQSDCEAVVVGTYAEQYWGENVKDYTIHIKGHGPVSWYKEHQLELIEAGRGDLLDKWEADAKAEEQLKSDIDWVFDNGEEVLINTHLASVQALADCFGLENLWGSRGEGIDLHSNIRQTLILAKPFLLTGDKQGWLDLSKKITTTVMSTTTLNEPLKIEVQEG